MLVQLQKITKNYSTLPIFENLNLQINEQERIGLIGINGCGKSTIMKLIAGFEQPDQGTISLKKKLKIDYLAQTAETPQQLAKDYILGNFTDYAYLQIEMKKLELEMIKGDADLGGILAKYGTKQEEFQELGGYNIESRLETIANGLGAADLLDCSMDTLSGGERTQIGMVKILLQDADLFLLDEPTNHLDAARIVWLENYLVHAKAACLIVSHDHYFLEQVATKIIELEDGEVLEYKGNYSVYKTQKELHIEKLKRDFAEQQKEIKKLKLAIRRYRQWGNENNNEKFYKRAKHLEKRLERMERIKKPKTDSEVLAKDFKESARSALSKYSFYKDDVMKLVKNLSGGEKVRLELAKIMQHKINLLILDEPTNNLNIETREEIKEILEGFAGTILAISHDRFFLDKLFQKFLVIENQRVVVKL